MAAMFDSPCMHAFLVRPPADRLVVTLDTPTGPYFVTTRPETHIDNRLTSDDLYVTRYRRFARVACTIHDGALLLAVAQRTYTYPTELETVGAN